MKMCGIEVQKYVLEQLASSHSVLTEDQKKLGVCLIDIGGGTSDVAIFSDGAISHTVNVQSQENMLRMILLVQFKPQFKMQKI